MSERESEKNNKNIADRRSRVSREITAGFLVFRRTSEGPKFLLLYHRGSYWNFPKGHLESEEKAFDAAVRETYEETGLRRSDLKIIPNFKAYERFYFWREEESIFFRIEIVFKALAGFSLVKPKKFSANIKKTREF